MGKNQHKIKGRESIHKQTTSEKNNQKKMSRRSPSCSNDEDEFEQQTVDELTQYTLNKKSDYYRKPEASNFEQIFESSAKGSIIKGSSISPNRGITLSNSERLNENIVINRKSKNPTVTHSINRTSSKSVLVDGDQIIAPPILSANKELFYQIIILILILIIMLPYFDSYLPWKSNLNQSISYKKTCKFTTLIKKYPLEDSDLWITLKYGIEDILNAQNPEGPSVYLFLHNKNSTAVNFVEDIADSTASCFDPNLEPISLKKDDFNTEDYGIAIAKYKKDIHNGGVLVVSVNLNEVPGAAARALHTICDKYSPIVKKVVIFLSLVIDSNSKGLPLQIAEHTLRALWRSSLSKDELDPLIVRVSDTVFRLQS